MVIPKKRGVLGVVERNEWRGLVSESGSHSTLATRVEGFDEKEETDEHTVRRTG